MSLQLLESESKKTMSLVKKLTRKTALTLGLSIACTFTGLPSAASETSPSAAPIILAHADTTLPVAETGEDTSPAEVSAETRAKIS